MRPNCSNFQTKPKFVWRYLVVEKRFEHFCSIHRLKYRFNSFTESEISITMQITDIGDLNPKWQNQNQTYAGFSKTDDSIDWFQFTSCFEFSCYYCSLWSWFMNHDIYLYNACTLYICTHFIQPTCYTTLDSQNGKFIPLRSVDNSMYSVQ